MIQDETSPKPAYVNRVRDSAANGERDREGPIRCADDDGIYGPPLSAPNRASFESLSFILKLAVQHFACRNL